MAHEPRNRDHLELVTLRVGLARVCQTAGVETTDLPIIGMSFHQLASLAKDHGRGWNTLAGELQAFIERTQERARVTVQNQN
jgi:hypothetical protein